MGKLRPRQLCKGEGQGRGGAEGGEVTGFSSSAVIPGVAKRRPGIHSGTVQEWIPDRRGFTACPG
ncbi:hypothetical protein BOS5A_200412 [Bosea sp. EC-HK365B]|nr:hypothetical protein BOSE21B_110360 [Bosea sp. 21B]CAD5280985.1 hypothetical protein BOSE7B_40855 [Bosea sp. 7B]VVT58091.1 hypothetical protein BOS5A_200412 [Bosea sp. EC-HK365B]